MSSRIVLTTGRSIGPGLGSVSVGFSIGSNSRATVCVAIVLIPCLGGWGLSDHHQGRALPERYPWVDSPFVSARPDLAAALELVATADEVISGGVATLRDAGGPDVNQVLAYDVAHAAA